MQKHVFLPVAVASFFLVSIIYPIFLKAAHIEFHYEDQRFSPAVSKKPANEESKMLDAINLKNMDIASFGVSKRTSTSDVVVSLSKVLKSKEKNALTAAEKVVLADVLDEYNRSEKVESLNDILSHILSERKMSLSYFDFREIVETAESENNSFPKKMLNKMNVALSRTVATSSDVDKIKSGKSLKNDHKILELQTDDEKSFVNILINKDLLNKFATDIGKSDYKYNIKLQSDGGYKIVNASSSVLPSKINDKIVDAPLSSGIPVLPLTDNDEKMQAAQAEADQAAAAKAKAQAESEAAEARAKAAAKAEQAAREQAEQAAKAAKAAKAQAEQAAREQAEQAAREQAEQAAKVNPDDVPAVKNVIYGTATGPVRKKVLKASAEAERAERDARSKAQIEEEVRAKAAQAQAARAQAEAEAEDPK